MQSLGDRESCFQELFLRKDPLAGPGEKESSFPNNDRSTGKLAQCHSLHSPPHEDTHTHTHTHMKFYSLSVWFIALCCVMLQNVICTMLQHTRYCRSNLIWHLCNECERQVFLSEKGILKEHFHHNEWQNWGFLSLFSFFLLLSPPFIKFVSQSKNKNRALPGLCTLLFHLLQHKCQLSENILVGKQTLPFCTHLWTHKKADQRSVWCCSVEWVEADISVWFFCTDNHIIELITN